MASRGTNGHGPGHQHGDETRSKIIETALALIADHGFAATTTREISEQLGFTKAALYYHFRTKDDLLAAIVGPALDGLAALVTGTRPRRTAGARRRAIADYVALASSHVDLIRVLANDPSARGAPALAPASASYERLVQILSGTEHPDTSQRTRVWAALGAVHAALLHAEPDDDPDIVRATALAAANGALALPDEDDPAGADGSGERTRPTRRAGGTGPTR